MSRLSREAFISQFQATQIDLSKVDQSSDLSQSVKMNLRKADLNRDGKLSGRNELDRAFSRLDNYDRDGSSNSIRIERNGEQTALGRVVDALADSVSNASPATTAPQQDYHVALESIRRGLVTLDRGDRGGTVRALQTGLKELGYTVTTDGDFGPQTERALQSFNARIA